MIIKFSHDYDKLKVLGNIPKARLLEVFDSELSDLSSKFLEYDTDNHLYPLPKAGEYLTLLFVAQNGLFTTIRRKTPEKRKYYRENRGEVFNISISK